MKMAARNEIAIVKISGSTSNVGAIVALINDAAEVSGIDVDFITVKANEDGKGKSTH